METNQFRLVEQRDFGNLFNDTFLFIKYNYKKLLKGLFYFVVPVALIQGIITGMIQYRLFNTGMTNSNIFSGEGGIFLPSMLNYLFILLFYSMSLCYTYSFLKLYRDKGNTDFSMKELWNEILGFIPKTIGALLLCGIIATVGMIALVIPGIYIMICISLAVPILIFEEESIGRSIGNSFELIKGHWWETFGFLIVMSIISSVINFVFQLPSTIYVGVSAFFNATGNPMQTSQSLHILFGMIQSIGYAFVQLIPIVGIALQYFNLIERKKSPSLLKDLETVGTDE